MNLNSLLLVTFVTFGLLFMDGFNFILILSTWILKDPKSKSKSRLMTGFSLKSDFPTTHPATRLREAELSIVYRLNLPDYGRNLVVVSQNPQDYGSTAKILWIMAQQPKSMGLWQNSHKLRNCGRLAIILLIMAAWP